MQDRNRPERNVFSKIYMSNGKPVEIDGTLRITAHRIDDYADLVAEHIGTGITKPVRVNPINGQATISPNYSIVYLGRESTGEGRFDLVTNKVPEVVFPNPEKRHF